MARKTIVQILDDFDGSEGASTVTFSLEGKAYEIDLSAENKAKLVDALAPFVKVARSASAGRASSKGSRKDLAAIREWANANGYEVSPKGRIPFDVVEAYDAAK